MDKTMNDPIEQRIKTLELKVEFLENWKNTPFIQVTLPVVLSIFLATSWNSFGLISMEKRIESLEKRVDKHDSEIKSIFEAIKQLISPTSDKPKRKIGFSI